MIADTEMSELSVDPNARCIGEISLPTGGTLSERLEALAEEAACYGAARLEVEDAPPECPEVDGAILMIGPETAAELVAYNTHNRLMRSQVANRMAADIIDGFYVFNGATIKFSKSGVLLDGQHRLESIIRSGETVPCLLIWNLPMQAQETTDKQAKRRLSQMLDRLGEKDSTKLAAAINWLHRYDTAQMKRRGSNTYPTTRRALALLDEHPAIREYHGLANRLYGGLGFYKGLAMFFGYALDSIDEADSETFTESLITGANLESDHPVLTLRHALERMRGSKDSRAAEKMAYMTALGWNAYREGRKPSVIRWNPNSPFPVLR